MKVLIIDGSSRVFDQNSGTLNQSISDQIQLFLKSKNAEIQLSHVDEIQDLNEEVEKFVWADLIVFHTPVWWFGLPYPFKGYLDQVFSKGRGKIYANDGRHHDTPKLNYGNGGLLKSTRYMLISTWNAPYEAFYKPGELMYERPPDEGVFYGFHKMCSFIGLSQLPSFHFFDVVKDLQFEKDMQLFNNHLNQTL
ncbi:NAD(P)H-dependent oxidoreductase [Flavobacteriaceae bacterium]|nr:NAD(P)H-dependent oxidoreductase [Flavobacteriaceae bacterium]